MKRVFLAALTASGCMVAPADWAGQACDANHGCFDGRECDLPSGRCIDPTLVQPKSCVVWSQAQDGFAGTRQGSGASVQIDAVARNHLVVQVPSALDGTDFAVAQVADERLSKTSEGQLVGRFVAPTGSRIDGAAPFLVLRAESGSVLELTLNPNWELSAFSGASVLQPQPVVHAPISSNRFPPGPEYLLRVAWRAGAFLRVAIDGRLIFDDSLQPIVGTGSRPTKLELGVLRYDGNGHNPLALTFSDFVLCDNAETSF